MCGIVGYVGEQRALDVVMQGLRRLEYRGYDSAGVAVLDSGAFAVERRAGKLANLDAAIADSELPGTLGIGHTRWATHGAPTDRNAHPHTDCHGAVAIVHNGTIENFAELREGLEHRGHTLRSETDTEAVAHLIEERYADNGGDLAGAVRDVARGLEGSFVLVVSAADQPELVIGARRNLPLVVGLGDGENFLASDVTAFIAYTRTARAVEQDQIVELRRDGVRVTDLDGQAVEGATYHVDWDTAAAEKAGYEYFMLKEIEEQPEAVKETIGGRLSPDGRLRLDELAISDEDIRGVHQAGVVACGAADHPAVGRKDAVGRGTRRSTQGRIA